MVFLFQIVELVCSSIETVFKDDRTGEISLAIVKQLNNLVKSKPKSLTAPALYTLLSLQIKDIDRRDSTEKSTHEERKRLRREKLKLMSRKARKRAKEMVLLERELRENDMEFNKKLKLRTHTEIMNIVFTIYFRTLKQFEHYSLLGPVLEGLSKFAHLISVEFFDDLISTLHGLLESGVQYLKLHFSSFSLCLCFCFQIGDNIIFFKPQHNFRIFTWWI